MKKLLAALTASLTLSACTSGYHDLLIDDGERFTYSSYTGRSGAYAEAKCRYEFGKHAKRVKSAQISGFNVTYECVDTYQGAENEHCRGRENPQPCLNKIRAKIEAGDMEYRNVQPWIGRSQLDPKE